MAEYTKVAGQKLMRGTTLRASAKKGKWRLVSPEGQAFKADLIRDFKYGRGPLHLALIRIY
jgi:hypothetical protein